MPRAILVGVLVAAAVFAGAMAAGGDDADRPAQRAAAPQRAAAAPDGREVFALMGCGSCHTLAAAGSKGEIGPRLDTVLSGHTRASLRKKIVDPASSAPYSGMPDDFGDRMNAAELDALLDFLVSAARRS